MAIEFTPFIQDTPVHPLSPGSYDTSATAGSINGTSENMSSSCRSISRYEAAMLWSRSGKDASDEHWLSLIPGSKSQPQLKVGFVKLYTRLDALEAKEILSGKQWDHDGQKYTLKVEMAKKNLQVKRNSTGDTTLILSPHAPSSSITRKTSFQAAFDAFHSISPSITDTAAASDMAYDLFNSTPSTPTMSMTDNIMNYPARSGSLDARNDVGGLVSSRLPKSLNVRLSRSLADADDELARQLGNLRTSIQSNNERGFNNVLFGSDDLTLSSRFLSMNNCASPLPSPGLAGNSYRSYSNPNVTDQNPPCNTLYVGNLPSNTKEEELRQIFSRCAGYKRLCFRSKANGPLCFVEFDDVIRATQAMSELNGYLLSNSLKGGIRLSFSKNPLFTKPSLNNQQSMNHSLSAIGCNNVFGVSAFSTDKRDNYFIDSQFS
ncbi:unnamed protein product [Umbelopsis sp. WA50703]